MESPNTDLGGSQQKSLGSQVKSAFKWILIGCSGISLLGIGSCAAGVWYIGHQGKKAYDEFQAARAQAGETLQEQKDPDRIPRWVPTYPETEPLDAFFTTDGETGSGFFRLNIQEEITELASSFEENLTASGFSVQANSAASGQAAQIIGNENDGTRVVTISLTNRSDAVSAVVRYLW